MGYCSWTVRPGRPGHFSPDRIQLAGVGNIISIPCIFMDKPVEHHFTYETRRRIWQPGHLVQVPPCVMDSGLVWFMVIMDHRFVVPFTADTGCIGRLPGQKDGPGIRIRDPL